MPEFGSIFEESAVVGFVTQKHQKLRSIRIGPPNATGIVVHALHKSGSMFLYNLCFRLCRTRQIRFYSGNHPHPDDDQVEENSEYDFCLGPVRDYCLPASLQHVSKQDHSSTVKIRQVFHVRDPRDLLVSQYFSYGWRHSDGEFSEEQVKQREAIRGMGIDEYVVSDHLAVRAMKRRLKPLLQHPEKDSLEKAVIVKYEQMVGDFPEYLAQLLPVFSFRFPRLVKARYSLRYRWEFNADKNAMSHKRAVTPGDYQRQLKSATIERLNHLFADELLAMGYSSD